MSASTDRSVDTDINCTLALCTHQKHTKQPQNKQDSVAALTSALMTGNISNDNKAVNGECKHSGLPIPSTLR